jgi:ketosteroid isomerase-like protein
VPTQETENTRRVVEVLRRLGSADFDGTAELLDPAFVQEYPYPPTPEVPHRIEGRAPFLEFVRGGMSSFDPYRYRVVDLWQTTDDDTVVCEYTSHTRLLATGTPYSNHYLGVFRFGADGKLLLWREFVNPVTIAELFARAGEAAERQGSEA